jgi:putative peptidoglycan lipid II flippase
MEFPTGMLGVALGTILLPSLSKHYVDQSPAEYSALLDWGLRLTLLLALPSAAALGLLAVPLISTLFFHGEFSMHDVWMTRQALVAYSLGLVGLILVKILAPGFYARQDIKTPVKIAIITLFATQIMNLAFIGWLKHAGLALAIGLGACMNAGLLYRQLRRQSIFQPQPGWPVFLIKLFIALAVMAGALWFAMGPNESWLRSSLLARILHLSGLIVLGSAAYFVTLSLLGITPKRLAKPMAE